MRQRAGRVVLADVDSLDAFARLAFSGNTVAAFCPDPARRTEGVPMQNNLTSRSSQYSLARLRRLDPALAERVLRHNLALYRARVEAGIVGSHEARVAGHFSPLIRREGSRSACRVWTVGGDGPRRRPPIECAGPVDGTRRTPSLESTFVCSALSTRPT